MSAVPLGVVPEGRTERCSPSFLRGDRFWSQVSDACRQAKGGGGGGEEKCWPPDRPYVTDPFHPLGSISNKLSSHFTIRFFTAIT